MSNVITGQLVGVNPAVTNGNYTSQKAIFLVNPGQYQSYVEIEFGGEKMSLLANVVPNQHYDVSVNIRGSKQTFQSTKNQGHVIAYNSIQAWKIEVQGQQAAAPQAQQGFQQQAPPQNQQGFGQQAPQNFNQQPAPTQQGFGQPQQQGFGTPQGASAPANFGAPQQGGFGQPNPNVQPNNGGFIGAPQQQGFGQ